MRLLDYVGEHNTRYECDDLDCPIAQIKVTKPDGKTFWIPIMDMRMIVAEVIVDKLANVAKKFITEVFDE